MVELLTIYHSSSTPITITTISTITYYYNNYCSNISIIVTAISISTFTSSTTLTTSSTNTDTPSITASNYKVIKEKVTAVYKQVKNSAIVIIITSCRHCYHNNIIRRRRVYS